MQQARVFSLLGLIVIVVAAVVLLTGWRVQRDKPPGGETTVIWISMDGFRSDYLDRAELPFFHRLMREEMFSRRFRPVFPSITFPSHSAESTGVPVAQHGITSNSFYDSATRKSYHFPADASLLQAEPIWLTAQRQSVRALVFDWPLSQNQHGAVQDEYFSRTFDNNTSDAQRLDHLLTAWQDDEGPLLRLGRYIKGTNPVPLRLLMGYVEGTDPVGHKFGPDSPEITAELQKLDREMGEFADSAYAHWKQEAGPADRFYLLLTTDHGMSKVDQYDNLEKMLGLSHFQKEIAVEMGGSVGNVFLDKVPAGAQREARTTALLAKLKAYPFVRAYLRADLPPAWRYDNPTRTGDIVVLVPKGHTFYRDPMPGDTSHGFRPVGMHGYAVEEDPEMFGVMFLARYPQAFGGKELGEVNWDQYHPTVAKLLGIRPADGAKGQPLALPGE